MQNMTYNSVFGFQGLAASIVPLRGCLMLRLGMQTAEFEQSLCVFPLTVSFVISTISSVWGHNQRCLRSCVGVSKSAIVPSCLSAVCLNATRLAQESQELTARCSPYTQHLSLHTVCSDDGVRQHERSAKPQLKNAIPGQSYRFWDFTISFYSISWLHHPHPLANCARKAFLHLHFASRASLTALRFLFQRFNCMVGVVWYLPTQLQITVAPSFLQLRNKLWIQFVGGNPGELSQRHAPCLSFTRQRLRSKPSTWSNAFALAIFI